MGERAFDYWAFFTEDAKRTGSPLYSRLAAGVGADEDLKALAARARKGQPHANLLFGAVHFLLLRRAEHPLRRFYATCGGTARVEDEDPFPLFRDFVNAHRAAIEKLVEMRVTNTNEVGRSALLHAGFRVLAEQAGAPLHLVEIGPSAGLNLIWDRYGVRYTKDGAPAAIAPAAPLVLDCQLRGESVPPTGPAPKVESRIGLELNPVDLSVADDRDWLRALIFADQAERLVRLDKAIALFAREKPLIRAGDALALLPEALAAAPREATLCVYHTIAVYQFSTAMKEALENILTVAGLRRPVYRLSFEYELEWAECMFSLIRYGDGARQERRLAKAHPHGTWLEWFV